MDYKRDKKCAITGVIYPLELDGGDIYRTLKFTPFKHNPLLHNVKLS